MPDADKYSKELANGVTTIAKNLYDIDRQMRLLNENLYDIDRQMRLLNEKYDYIINHNINIAAPENQEVIHGNSTNANE